MPFITLNNSWSNLAQYYNGSFTNKPQIPKDSDQFKSFDDGLIRGGILNAALATKKDVVNISNFLYKSSKGPLFIIKQVGLHLSNPLLEQKANRTVTKDENGKDVITYTQRKDKLGLLPTRIYNGGINTLASVAGNAFGLHFPKFGLLPTANYDYAKIAKENNDNSKYTLPTLTIVNPILPNGMIPSNERFETEVKVTGSPKSTKTITSLYTNKPNRLISYLGKLIENKDSTNPITLQSYLGGPDSVYGLVNTRIRTTGDNVTNKDSTKRINSFKPRSYEQISEIGDKLKNTGDTSYINYYNEDTKPTYIPLEYNYGVSHVGDRANSFKSSADSINNILITNSKTFYDNITKKASDVSRLYQNDGSYVEQTSIFGKDIIKFRIEILNNNQPVNGGVINTEVYAFRAYINELNDGIDAKWEPYRYMGRGEEFYIYNGFTRDISVGFTVFAHSKPEMKILYQKVNNLMSSFTPDYSTAGLMRGNIGYLTVGDYLYRIPGVFTSIKIGNLLDTHWETNLDGDMYELPKLMNITLSFKPIHSFVPRRNYAGSETAAFITPDVAAYYQNIGIGFTETKKDDKTGKTETTVTNRFIPAIRKIS